ncbi:MAG: diguanylate cyclase [Campylobacterota bacterium]|nr:diguanylate cyclase [Campylobacterota bacterium]
MLEQIEDADEVLTVVDEIKKVLPILCELDGEACNIGMSIGHACFPNEGSNLEQLISLADAKMYRAKECYYGYLT